jgi:hypothetical protein
MRVAKPSRPDTQNKIAPISDSIHSAREAAMTAATEGRRKRGRGPASSAATFRSFLLASPCSPQALADARLLASSRCLPSSQHVAHKAISNRKWVLSYVVSTARHARDSHPRLPCLPHAARRSPTLGYHLNRRGVVTPAQEMILFGAAGCAGEDERAY